MAHCIWNLQSGLSLLRCLKLFLSSVQLFGRYRARDKESRRPGALSQFSTGTHAQFASLKRKQYDDADEICISARDSRSSHDKACVDAPLSPFAILATEQPIMRHGLRHVHPEMLAPLHRVGTTARGWNLDAKSVCGPYGGL